MANHIARVFVAVLWRPYLLNPKHPTRVEEDGTPMDWAEVNGVSLRYDVRGEGPSLVLIHEMGGTLESWDGVIDQLAAHFRVLRFDQRSAGWSEKVRTPFTLDD